jgi:hypothetical protein
MEEEYERSTGAIFDAEEHTGLSRRGYAAGTEEASKELLQLIRNTIDRDSWGDPEGGGPGLGMIQVMGTSLVVTQTFKNHEAVAELLQMLRSDRDGRVIEVGVAVVRLDAPEAAKALRDVLAKAKDPVDVLTEGEDKGNWLLDRCRVEQTHLGDVIRVTHAYSRYVREVPKDANMIVLPHTTMYGYEIGVLAKSRDGGKVTVSVACGSGWIGKDDDPTKDTPAKTTGVRGRQNVFDFAMPIGDKPRVYPVVPLAARDGGVKVVVWLPKSGK